MYRVNVYRNHELIYSSYVWHDDRRKMDWLECQFPEVDDFEILFEKVS